MPGKKKNSEQKAENPKKAQFGKRTVHRNVKNVYSDILLSAPQTMKAKLTVGVAGVMPRIGATTQAIQIVLHMFYKNYNVAYVEMNDHGFVSKLENNYLGVRKDKNGNLVYRQITFVSRDNIKSVLNDDYDALVFDYGSYDDEEFDLISFSERNVQVFVCGCKPEETPNTIRTLIDTDLPYCKYIFSFVPEGEQDEALQIMEKQQQKATFFTEFIPDYFTYCSSDPDKTIYAQIIPKREQEEAEGE